MLLMYVLTSIIYLLQMLFTNLTTNEEYLLKVLALSSSLYREEQVYPGLDSEVHTLKISRNCDGIQVGGTKFIFSTKYDLISLVSLLNKNLAVGEKERH